MEVVGGALQYFGLHFQDQILMPELADTLGTTLACLDFSFDRIRGHTAAGSARAPSQQAVHDAHRSAPSGTLTGSERLWTGADHRCAEAVRAGVRHRDASVSAHLSEGR